MAITERMLIAKCYKATSRPLGLTQNYTIHSGRMTASRSKLYGAQAGQIAPSCCHPLVSLVCFITISV